MGWLLCWLVVIWLAGEWCDGVMVWCTAIEMGL